MELKQLRGKKSLKLLFLLFTTLLIGAVSATVYNYMYIQGTVMIGSAQIVWVKGSGAPSGTTIAGGLVTMGLSAQTGSNQTATNCLYLKNNNPSRGYNISISVTTANLNSTYFNSATIYLYDNTTSPVTFLHSINMATINTYTTTIGVGGIDRLDFQIYPLSTTTSGSYSFDIQVAYW